MWERKREREYFKCRKDNSFRKGEISFLFGTSRENSPFHFPENLLSGVSTPELESEHSDRGDSGKPSKDFSSFPVASSDMIFRLSSVPDESLRLWLGDEGTEPCMLIVCEIKWANQPHKNLLVNNSDNSTKTRVSDVLFLQIIRYKKAIICTLMSSKELALRSWVFRSFLNEASQRSDLNVPWWLSYRRHFPR